MSIKAIIYRKVITIIGNMKWLFLSNLPFWKGITCKEYEKEIVVSLTSFPRRINDVVYTIRSILMQCIKPNRIILWLAYSQFPNLEKDLPEKLLKLTKYGLEIRWYSDIRSYKKFIPSLAEFPESIIVTTDDDIFYRRNWLKKLYDGYKSDRRTIWAHRVTKFVFENNHFQTIPGGFDRWPNFSYLNKITGCGGVLYPPHIFDDEVLNEDAFRSLCRTNDDIWFWLMGVKNGIKVGVPQKPNLRLVYIGSTQESDTLTSINDHGENLFWKDFNAVINHYPDIRTRLMEEVALKSMRS